MPKLTYDEAVKTLQQKRKALRCSDVRSLLTDLGFKVRNGAQGNHKVYSHPGIPHFHGSNYDCGHGSDPVLKSVYIDNIRRVLERYESDLNTSPAPAR